MMHTDITHHSWARKKDEKEIIKKKRKYQREKERKSK